MTPQQKLLKLFDSIHDLIIDVKKEKKAVDKTAPEKEVSNTQNET